MGAYEGRGQLDKAIKNLLSQWQEARSSWDDAMSDKFEKDHLQPLAMDLRRATAAMGHIAPVLTAVHRDCD